MGEAERAPLGRIWRRGVSACDCQETRACLPPLQRPVSSLRQHSVTLTECSANAKDAARRGVRPEVQPTSVSVCAQESRGRLRTPRCEKRAPRGGVPEFHVAVRVSAQSEGWSAGGECRHESLSAASAPSKEVATLREVGERLDIGRVAAEHSHRLRGGTGRFARDLTHLPSTPLRI